VRRIGGDVNGDGYDDVVVGAYAFDTPEGSAAGKIYLYHGSSGGLASTPALTIEGEAAGIWFEYSSPAPAT